MNLVIVLVVAAVLAVALGAYLLVAARRRPVAVAASAPFDPDDGVVSEPVPIERAGAHPLERPPAFEPPPAFGDLAGAAFEDEPEFEPVESPSAAAANDAATGTPTSPEPVVRAGVAASAMTEAALAPEMCWAKRFAPRNGALDDSARLGLIRDLGLVRAPWGVPLLVQAYEEEADAAHRRAVLAALALYRHLDARAVFERALRSDDEGERALAGAALADLGVTPSLSS